MTSALASLDELAKRQRLEAEAARSMAKARIALIRGKDAKSAFFASLVMRLQPEPSWSVDTAATDGRRLRYNPEFWQSLPPAQRLGVLVHELLHCSNKHHARRCRREPRLWNVAADLAINPLCLDAGFTLPDGALLTGRDAHQKLPVGKSAEWYYRELQKQQAGEESQQPDSSGSDKASGEGDGNASGSASDAGDPGGCGGVVDAAPDAAGTERSDREWDVIVQQAVHRAQQRGELPGGLAANIAAQRPGQVDWKAVLRRFCQTLARDDYSWSRPNRRYVSQGLYLPSLRSERLGTLVLAVDCSGSCWGDAIFKAFTAELQGVLEVLPARVLILYHDVVVQGEVRELEPDAPLVLTPRGGGGTNHRPVFAWIDRHEPDAQAVICLTDLETRLPDVPPSYPVLWCSIEDHSAPFGEVLKISV